MDEKRGALLASRPAVFDALCSHLDEIETLPPNSQVLAANELSRSWTPGSLQPQDGGSTRPLAVADERIPGQPFFYSIKKRKGLRISTFGNPPAYDALVNWDFKHTDQSAVILGHE